MVEEQKAVILEPPEGVIVRTFDKEGWNPKTEIGMKVKSGEIKSIEEILNKGVKILEPQIVDVLVPELQSTLLSIGQSKGKFGGGKKSIWRQTQKKTKEGNKPNFGCLAVVGNKNGYVGIGFGKSKETMPAREKALRSAKLNLISIRRGCGSWACGCGKPHSIPFKTVGKCSSAQIELLPAPIGTGLCIEEECKKILDLAGIKDVYANATNSKNRLNLVTACFSAFKELSKTKVSSKDVEKLGVLKGRNE
ncbi:30S ribosomal protein S5 [Candidatus Woesearchaeota archaeon]|nr:30S ribosomal protein S5 [Candidatus Woesearchaeota archaeon]